MPRAKASASASAVKRGQKPYARPASLFVSRPKNLGLGGTVQPKRDVTRFVKWPKYVRLQRQRSILLRRLKVPPSIRQFRFTLDKNVATQLITLLSKYSPETKAEKAARLLAAAQAGEGSSGRRKPLVLKFGLNHVTTLVEQKKAKLVVIAHDVDPIELVLWLPALCRKMGVPYCIIKGKARLGQLVHQKTATCVALTDVADEHSAAFNRLVESCRLSLPDEHARTHWAEGEMGQKSQDRTYKKERLLLAEELKRA